MQFTIYRSTDGSAPQLTGQTGSLCTVLDAILVNGYGAKVAAGWTIPFTGTSKRVYRAPGGVRFYYRIQDDGPGAGTFKEARLTGYTEMTTVDVGIGQHPTTAQSAFNSQAIRKSATLDAVARAWLCFADARTCYFFAQSEGTALWMAFMIGEYFSIATPASPARGIIIGRFNENNAGGGSDGLDAIQPITTVPSASSAGMYAPMGFGGNGSSTPLQKDVGNGMTSNTVIGVGSITYPNPADSGLHMGPVWIHDAAANRIGRMRGFWCLFHVVAGFADGQTFSGSGPLAGKTFLIVKSSPNAGLFCMETSNTVETN
jgi:hypothetical protein